MTFQIPPTAAAASAIVAAQVSINVGTALGKTLFPLIGPEGVAALRTSLSALIMLIACRPWTIRLTRAQSIWVFLYGVSLGGMNLLIYWAIQRIPIGVAVAIEISGPLAVVLLTSRSTKDFVWFALAIVGLLLLVPWPGTGDRLDPAGISFALGAAACWSLYIVFGKQASQVENRTAVALGMCAACLVTIPFGVTAAGADFALPPVLIVGLVVALLSSTLPYLLEMMALERLSSRIFGVVISTAPAIAALVGFVFLGEVLSERQWLAIMLMIAASTGCSLSAAPTVQGAREGVMQ